MRGGMSKLSGNKKTMKMKQLVEASGVPKSTILLYVEKGLLPKPHKTSPNVAHYDADCVERLARIKHLQMEHGLSLDRIGKLLRSEDQGRDITPLVELNRTIFGDSSGAKVDLDAFCKRSGLTIEQAGELLNAGMLLPLEPEQYDEQDIALGAVIAQGLANGLTVDDMSFYNELGRQIVNHEMALRRKVTVDLPFEQDAETTKRMVTHARAMRSYIIDRIFQHRIAKSKHLKDGDTLHD